MLLNPKPVIRAEAKTSSALLWLTRLAGIRYKLCKEETEACRAWKCILVPQELSIFESVNVCLLLAGVDLLHVPGTVPFTGYRERTHQVSVDIKYYSLFLAR